MGLSVYIGGTQPEDPTPNYVFLSGQGVSFTGGFVGNCIQKGL